MHDNRSFSVAVAMLLAGASVQGAQQPKDAAAPPAPVPVQIVSGQRVFVANAGEENLTTAFRPVFSGGPDRAYNQFYAAIEQWGRYKLVSDPGQADLAFEIAFTLGSGNSPLETFIGHLRMVIRDPGIRFVDRGMLHFPKERDQHRDDLIFSPDFVALPALAVVLERLNVAVVFDGVSSPGGEDLTQFAVDFRQPTPRERQDANTGKIVQTPECIDLRSAFIESRSLLAPPKLLKRALARFDTALDGQSFVPLQPSRD
jgi:hypothetical protein